MRRRGRLLSLGQVVVLVFAILAIVLVYRFPPYYTDTGLIGGTAYFLSGRPPIDSGDNWSLNSALRSWELFFIGLTLCAALIAFRRHADQNQRRYMLIGLAVEAAFLGGSIPSFGTILGPEFTWNVMNALAGLVLYLVLAMGPDSRSALQSALQQTELEPTPGRANRPTDDGAGGS